MGMIVRFFAATAVAACLLTVALAAPPQATVVSISSEMCNGCVRKISAKLHTVANVQDVKCDIKTRSVTLTPEPGRVLSPRAVWEALESIGKQPARLAGPSGTFTSKPSS